jgi:predicted ATP-grasp superfamily ATP-dependent carboligase
MAEILVAGLSARALSASARRAGYIPLAADFFGDLDLKESAEASTRVEGDLAGGFEWDALSGALCALAGGREVVGIVCGTGFEDRPELLQRIADKWMLFGNSAEAVRAAKDAEHLAATCSPLGISHPEIRLEGGCGDGWLRKQRGGSGGAHVSGIARHADSYWQRRVGGAPVSALVLGNGTKALALGLSAQWADPVRGAPFRYGGAVRPADIGASIAEAIEGAARKVVEALGLVGLNSVDFLVDGDAWYLIEVNPRPGATLDIFDSHETPLFALHVAACRGELPDGAPTLPGAAAARILYAVSDVVRVPRIDWPDWTADRQPPGTNVTAGAPLCTVLAQADSAAEARRLVAERGDRILAAIEAAP